MKEKIIKLRPLTRFCMTIGELPTSYLISLTYEETLLWLCNYLEKTVIPTVNNNSKVVEELQKLYEDLKEYVDNYFDELNIQEEVDNKIQELLDSGQLEEMILEFLTINNILGFDNKASLKNAENLIDGTITKTLGDVNYLDGLGEFYRIRTKLESDIIDEDNIISLNNFNNLIGEKIPNTRINDLTNKIDKLENSLYDYNVDRIISVAHRGLSCCAPENTIASIIKAGNNHNDCVELDVQVTSDGELVLMHDLDVDRMTDGTGVVNNLTYAYINSLTIDNGNYVDRVPTQKVPLLSEALLTCNKYNLIPMLELKGTWNDNSLNTLINNIKKYNLEHKVIVISFTHQYLADLRRLNENIKIMLLAGGTIYDGLIDYAISLKKCGISAPYVVNEIIPENQRLRMIENNVPFGFWTLNDINITREIINNNHGLYFIVGDYGFGTENQRQKRMIGVINNTGFNSWNKTSGGAATVALLYEDFNIEDLGNNSYRLNYASPFYTNIGGYIGNPSVKIEGEKANKYTIPIRSQSFNSFILFFIRNSDGAIVSLQDVINDLGSAYVSITV